MYVYKAGGGWADETWSVTKALQRVANAKEPQKSVLATETRWL